MSLGITVGHHSASLKMPNGDHRDRFFYPTLTLMIYFYILRKPLVEFPGRDPSPPLDHSVPCVCPSSMNVVFPVCIIELLGHCKGGKFSIHIWTWFGYFICSRREIGFYI